MAKICRVLDVSMEYLLGTEGSERGAEPVPEIQTVPMADLLARIGAQPATGGYGTSPNASAERRAAYLHHGAGGSRARGGRADASPARIQVVEVVGRCMERLIFAGDLAHVDTQRTPNPGDIAVAVRFRDEIVVKFLRERDGRRFLEGVDGTTVPLDQFTRIVGPMVALQISTARLLREQP